MESAASGSSAVLQMQQNMAAAPNVQQAEANKMQEQQLKLQQEQANLEKTKLDNLLNKTNFDRSSDAMKKLQTIVGTDEYKGASDADKARLIARVQGEAGLAESAESSMRTADALELSALNKGIKKADSDSRLIQNAVGVIEQFPDDTEGVKAAIDGLPKESRDALLKKLGSNYDKMDGKQIKKAAADLMYSASGKLAEMKLQAQIKIAQARQEALITHWQQQAFAAIAKRDKGEEKTADKEERAKWKDYKTASSRLDRNFQSEIKEIDKKIENAEPAAKKSAPYFQEAFGRKQTPEQKALADLVKKKEDAQKTYMGQLRIMAKRSGDEDEIDRVEALWKDQFGEEEDPPPKDKPTPGDPKPTPAPTDKPAPSREVSGKVGDATKPTPAKTKSIKPNSKGAVPKAMLDKANAAIKAGADPKAVLKRLTEAGYDAGFN
jgi:hypothetical protein